MNLVKSNSSGFTLIELMVALVILSVALLGLASITITAIQVNQQNELRNAAVLLTSQTAEKAMADSIDSLASIPETSQSVRVRGVATTFKVTKTVTQLTTDLRQVDILVKYTYRGQDKTNEARIFKHRAM